MSPWFNGSVANNTDTLIPVTFNNIVLTILNPTTASFTFNMSQTNLSTISSALESLFQPDAFYYRPRCVYPFSGQYGLLSRLLFYVLLVFSLVFRRRLWLSTAALGTAMTYGSVAAVHGCLLIARYRYNRRYTDSHLTSDLINEGDPDLIPIIAILTAGLYMLIPILSFSKTVRQNDARSVIFCWGALLLAALIVAGLQILKNRGIPIGWGDTQLATCQLNISTGCTDEGVYEVQPNGIKNARSYDFYHKCNCTDTCGALTPVIPFRRDTGMQVWLIKNRTAKLHTAVPRRLALTLIGVAVIVVCVRGVIWLLEYRWTLQELRAAIYRRVANVNRHAAVGYRGLFSRGRAQVARIIAAAFYLFTLTSAVLSFAIFIVWVMTIETILDAYPVSEGTDAIGQWGPWVGAGLVAAATLIQRYHNAWIRSVKAAFNNMARFMQWAHWRSSSGEQGPRNRNISGTLMSFLVKSIGPFKRMWRSLVETWEKIKFELTDFRAWWRAPNSHVTQDWNSRQRLNQSLNGGILGVEASNRLPDAPSDHAQSSFELNVIQDNGEGHSRRDQPEESAQSGIPFSSTIFSRIQTHQPDHPNWVSKSSSRPSRSHTM